MNDPGADGLSPFEASATLRRPQGDDHSSSLHLHIWNAISQCDSREVTARDKAIVGHSAVFG